MRLRKWDCDKDKKSYRELDKDKNKCESKRKNEIKRRGNGEREREIAGPEGGSRRDISRVLMSWQSKY